MKNSTRILLALPGICWTFFIVSVVLGRIDLAYSGPLGVITFLLYLVAAWRISRQVKISPQMKQLQRTLEATTFAVIAVGIGLLWGGIGMLIATAGVSEWWALPAIAGGLFTAYMLWKIRHFRFSQFVRRSIKPKRHKSMG